MKLIFALMCKRGAIVSKLVKIPSLDMMGNKVESMVAKVVSAICRYELQGERHNRTVT